jgi:hypothetical protein
VEKELFMLPSKTAGSAAMDEALRRARQDAAGLPPEGLARICEDLRLQFLYPGEYVAYVDSWQGKRPTRQLARRVIAHAAAYPEVLEHLTSLPDKLRSRAQVTYVFDPTGPIEHR